MSSANLIRGSRAPFSAPVLVIPKPKNPDGSSRGFRLVTDYRALNKIVEPIQHHIPDVHAMYEKLRNAKYISTLDLKNGYWNAGLTEKSKSLTSFSTEFGQYEYNVVPQYSEPGPNSRGVGRVRGSGWVCVWGTRHAPPTWHRTTAPSHLTWLRSCRVCGERLDSVGQHAMLVLIVVLLVENSDLEARSVFGFIDRPDF